MVLIGSIKPMKSNKSHAFSLVELAIVISIISLLLALGYNGLKNQLDFTDISTNNSKLKTIQSAIENYRLKFGKYPCPAQAGIPESDANFGVAATNCFTANPANTVTLANGIVNTVNDLAIGTIPHITLGLPNELGQDSWNNRFSYSVDAKFTQDDNNCERDGSITIVDYNSNAVSNKAVYALVSHGKDGLGGYKFSTGVRNACSSTTRDAENCNDADSIFRSTDQLYSDTPADYFDDYAVWATNPKARSCPEGLSSCNSWYDGADKCAVLTDASNNVIKWFDKSSNAFDATVPLGSTSPTYVVASGSLLNGKPFLRFNGTTEMLSAQRTANPLTNVSYGLSFKSAASQAFLFGKGDAALYTATNNDIVVYIETSTLKSWTFNGANITLSTAAAIDSTVPHYVVMTLGASRGYRLNYDGVNVGSNAITASTNAANTTYTLIGAGLNCQSAQPGGACYLNGDIHEAIFFNKELTADEEKILNNYLSKKWK